LSYTEDKTNTALKTYLHSSHKLERHKKAVGKI